MSSSSTLSDRPMPTGPRFAKQNLRFTSDFDSGDVPRTDVVARARHRFDSGYYDDPDKLDRQLDACMDKILADVMSA